MKTLLLLCVSTLCWGDLAARQEAVTFLEYKQALHKDAASAEAAAKALALMGPKAEEALPDLMSALHFDEASTAKAVQEALIAVGPAAVSPLVHALGDSSFIVRQRAATVLGEMKADSARVVTSLTALLTDPSYDVQPAAEFALVRAGKPAIAAVSAAMRREQGNRRKVYVDVLPKLGSDSAPILMAVLLKDENAFLRAAAATGLGTLQPPSEDVVAALMRALLDLQEVVRAEAVDALANLRKASAVAVGPLTILSVTDQDPLVRQKASQAIESLGRAGSAALPGLVGAYRHENQEVRLSALRQIIRSEVPYGDIQTFVQNAFQDNDSKIRLLTVQELGASRLDAPQTKLLLELALKDRSSEVRIAAEAALHPSDPKPAPAIKSKSSKKKR